MKAAKTVVLVGPPSVGKSTLIRWFASRCDRALPRVVPLNWTRWAVWWEGVNLLTFDDFVVREIQNVGLLARCLAAPADIRDPVVVIESHGEPFEGGRVDRWLGLDCGERMLRARQFAYAKHLTDEDRASRTDQARRMTKSLKIPMTTNSTPAESEIAILDLAAALGRPLPLGPPILRRRTVVQRDLYRGWLRSLVGMRHSYNRNPKGHRQMVVAKMPFPRYNPGVVTARLAS